MQKSKAVVFRAKFFRRAADLRVHIDIGLIVLFRKEGDIVFIQFLNPPGTQQSAQSRNILRVGIDKNRFQRGGIILKAVLPYNKLLPFVLHAFKRFGYPRRLFVRGLPASQKKAQIILKVHGGLAALVKAVRTTEQKNRGFKCAVTVVQPPILLVNSHTIIHRKGASAHTVLHGVTAVGFIDIVLRIQFHGIGVQRIATRVSRPNRNRQRFFIRRRKRQPTRDSGRQFFGVPLYGGFLKRLI